MIVGVWLHYIPEEKENIEKYDKTTSRYLKFRDKLQRQLGVWKPKNTWCRQEWYIQMVYQMEEKIIFVKKVEYSMKNFFFYLQLGRPKETLGHCRGDNLTQW